MGHGIWLLWIFYLQDFKGATWIFFWYSICPLPNFRKYYVLVSYYTFFLLPQFIPSFLPCFPPKHRMQQAHHFLVAMVLRQVVRCLASVDRSWWGQRCDFRSSPQALASKIPLHDLISCNFDFNLPEMHHSLATPTWRSSWSDGWNQTKFKLLKPT